MTLLIETLGIASGEQQGQPDGADVAALMVLTGWLTESPADFTKEVPVVLRTVIRRFAAADARVLQSATASLAACVRRTTPAGLADHIDFVRNSIRTVASVDKFRADRKKKDGEEDYTLPAFGVPKGIDPLVDAYVHALMHGATAELRESAAEGLGEIVDLTSPDALKSSVVKIAGPLIRVVGDRFPSAVKIAILDALRKLMGKGGAVLRPFLPQLQTTFVKALQNSSDAVRANAEAALKSLVPLSPRLDPLVAELLAGVGNAASSSALSAAALASGVEDPSVGIRVSLLRALLDVLVLRGSSATPAPVPAAGLAKILEDASSPVAACVTDPSSAAVRVLAVAVEAAAALEMRSTGADVETVSGGGSATALRSLASLHAQPDVGARHGASVAVNAAVRARGADATFGGVVDPAVVVAALVGAATDRDEFCLLYTSDAADD